MAIRNKYKEAFSLVEVLISMIILMLVTTCMLSVLTKAKPRIEETTIQGQFICYWEGNRVYQWQASNRTPDSAAPELRSSGTCEFELTKRPAFLYALLVGGGSSNSNGQVRTESLSTIQSKLSITPGKHGGSVGGDTVIKGHNGPGNENPDALNTFDSIVAMGGRNNSNHLVPENVKDCYLLTAGSRCQYPNPLDSSDETDKKHLNDPISSCRVGDVSYNGSSDIISVVYKGCVYGQGGIVADKLTDLQATSPNNYMTTYRSPKGYTMGFTLHDTSFRANESTNWKNSKVARILDTLPSRRESSELIEKIKAMQPGIMGKDGAVIILW